MQIIEHSRRLSPTEMLRNIEVSDNKCLEFPVDDLYKIRGLASKITAKLGYKYTIYIDDVPSKEEGAAAGAMVKKTCVWRIA